MSHIRRAFPISIGLATAAACVLLACGDDDSAVTPTPDGSTPDSSKPDTGGPIDSGGGTDTGVDTGPADTGVDTGADAGPTMSTTVGYGGQIFVGADAVLASFYEDDSILHWSNAPGCVAFVRSPNKKVSAAGTLTVAGQVVGSDGGTDTNIVVDPDPDNGYFYFGPVYPAVDTITASVQLEGLPPPFAALAADNYRPPREAAVPITAPAAPDASTPPGITASSPYTITWTAPTGGFVNDQQISVSLAVLGAAAVGSKNTQLFCTFPLNAGTGTIPANVLTEVKARGGAGALDAQMHIYAGTAKEVKTGNGSYFVEVARADSTSLQFDFPVKLQ